jgi:integrase
MSITDRKKPEVTTAIILESRKTNVKGEHPVKLRITYNRVRKYYTLKKEHYTQIEFDAIVNPKARGINKERFNKFHSVEQRAINIIDNVLTEFSFEAFEYEYLNHKKRNTTIQGYFDEKINELESVGKVGTASGYKATIISLVKFDKNISFQKITPKYLKKYENWFVEQGKSYTSVGIYMRNLRHIVNLAIKDRLINSYPFGEAKDKYQIPVSNNTKKALKLSEIALFFNYKTDIEQEITSLKYWLFSYLCNGMNFVDMLSLKYSNIEGDTLKFIRQKTKDTSKHKTKIEVVLLPETFEIIEQLGNPDKAPNNYIFPVLNDELTPKEKKRIVAQHIQTTNKYIKRIAKKIGIDSKISTYYARHSYSTIIRDSGASTEFIAEQLGHQSTKVTQSYLDSFPKESKKKFQQSIIPK